MRLLVMGRHGRTEHGFLGDRMAGQDAGEFLLRQTPGTRADRRLDLFECRFDHRVVVEHRLEPAARHRRRARLAASFDTCFRALRRRGRRGDLGDTARDGFVQGL